MIAKILDFKYEDLVFHHVRMNFSADMNDIGKVQLKKFFELFRVILLIIWKRIFNGASVLYYPPAGPNKVPIIRDIIILVTTRFLFRKTIFHFHAGGLSEKFNELSPLLQKLYKLAYFKPDLTIRLSKLNPDDGNFVQSKCDVIVPYGIDDVSSSFTPAVADGTIKILFTGVLMESKGVSELIRATKLIREQVRDISIRVWLMGRFESQAYEQELRSMINQYDLESIVQIVGTRTGREKFEFFNDCDVFCFPSFFESETFGIVLLEAMQFAKPVVTTRWRGIPDVVDEGVTAILADIGDTKALSDALLRMIRDHQLRSRLGNAGRERFLKYFTTDVFKENLHAELSRAIHE